MKIKLFTLPNIITLMNLACGSLAVVVLITLPTADAMKTAFVLMLAAAVFDFCDGLAARLTGQYSKLGVQLDSLADMVSFGLLPSVIAFNVFRMTGGEGWWGAATLFIAAFSALRLGKFNIDESQKTEFEGLPTPANAILVGAVGWFVAVNPAVAYPAWTPWVVIGCSLLLSWLLISPIRMFSLKFEGLGLRKNAVRYIFLLCAATMVALFGLSGFAPAIVLYIVYSATLWLVCPSGRQGA